MLKSIANLPNQIWVMSQSYGISQTNLIRGLANSQRVNSSPLKQIEAIVMKKMKSALVGVRLHSWLALETRTIMLEGPFRLLLTQDLQGTNLFLTRRRHCFETAKKANRGKECMHHKRCGHLEADKY